MLHVKIHEKSMGAHTLLKSFELRVEKGEKVGFLGRNGAGKTTLFNLISGKDTDFDGSISLPKHTIWMATSQEHTNLHDDKKTTLEHLTSKLPRYSELHHIITTYPKHMEANMKKIETYSSALEEFADLGYYDVESSLSKFFAAYQLDTALLSREFRTLSGGQKRLVELTTIQLAEPHLALLDEPTNHMDYIGKAAFVQWLKATKSAVFVISHDRDVLQTVDRIIELKDKKAFSYGGNYDKYLSQNATKTANAINEFEIAEKRMTNLREQIAYAKSRAPGYKGKAGKNPWIVMQDRLQRELNTILLAHDKPSFWIDSESTNALTTKASAAYEKYKAKNITLTSNALTRHDSVLMEADRISIGYEKESPLFTDISMRIAGNDRLHVVGRNGAGKTTLIKALIAASEDIRAATVLHGFITVTPQLRLSVYEQEIGPELLSLSLFDAIEHILRSKGVAIQEQLILRTMSSYLFGPSIDRDLRVNALSGGQKARLQLIRLLAGDPNLLILDEPTNHLDLPSIEELETHLKHYNGAIIYITHDSYFAKTLGGQTLNL